MLERIRDGVARRWGQVKQKDRSKLKKRFGERVSFDKTERLLYSHDTLATWTLSSPGHLLMAT